MMIGAISNHELHQTRSYNDSCLPDLCAGVSWSVVRCELWCCRCRSTRFRGSQWLVEADSGRFVHSDYDFDTRVVSDCAQWADVKYDDMVRSRNCFQQFRVNNGTCHHHIRLEYDLCRQTLSQFNDKSVRHEISVMQK